MKGLVGIVRDANLFTQLGISLVAPLLLCILICWWLCTRFSMDSWIYLPGILIGVGSSVMTAYKMYKHLTKGHKKTDRTEQVYFNEHT